MTDGEKWGIRLPPLPVDRCPRRGRRPAPPVAPGVATRGRARRPGRGWVAPASRPRRRGGDRRLRRRAVRPDPVRRARRRTSRRRRQAPRPPGSADDDRQTTTRTWSRSTRPARLLQRPRCGAGHRRARAGPQAQAGAGRRAERGARHSAAGRHRRVRAGRCPPRTSTPTASPSPPPPTSTAAALQGAAMAGGETAGSCDELAGRLGRTAGRAAARPHRAVLRRLRRRPRGGDRAAAGAVPRVEGPAHRRRGAALHVGGVRRGAPTAPLPEGTAAALAGRPTRRGLPRLRRQRPGRRGGQGRRVPHRRHLLAGPPGLPVPGGAGDCRSLTVVPASSDRPAGVRLDGPGRSIGSAPMRAPDDLPRRPRGRPAPTAGARSHRRRRGGGVRPAHVAAGHRPLLHRLPLVRLARPGRRVAGRARRQGRAWPPCFIAVFFVLAWATCSSPTASPRPTGSSGPEDELLERYHDLVSDRAMLGAGHRRRRAGADRRLGRVGRVELVDAVHQRRRLRRERPRSSARTSASTCSSCRSCRSWSTGCSRRC